MASVGCRGARQPAAALQWALGGGYTELGLRLASALCPFWVKRGFWSQGRSWLETALVQAPGRHSLDDVLDLLKRDELEVVPDSRVATVLAQIGSLAALQRDFRRATEASEASLRLCRRQGETRGVAWSLNSLGWVAVDQGDYPRASNMISPVLRSSSAKALSSFAR